MSSKPNRRSSDGDVEQDTLLHPQEATAKIVSSGSPATSAEEQCMLYTDGVHEDGNISTSAPPLPPRIKTDGNGGGPDDLNDIINSLLNKKGRFQIILIVLICLNSITVGINHTITSFHTYTPKFQCSDSLNTSCDQNCLGGYKFDEDDDTTLITEWSLVCDREYLGPLINSLYFAGVTAGALICGTLVDLWGRTKLTLACLYLQAVMAIGMYFATGIELFIVLRFVQGFFIQGLQSCSYTLMLEYCPARYRTAAAVLWELNWALGLAILGFASSLIQSWRVLTLVLLTPTFLSLLYFWIFPESISWLYAKQRYKEAFRLTEMVAKKNNDKIIIQECQKISLEEMPKPGDRDDKNRVLPPPERTSITDIVRCAVLRKHLICMIAVWFSVTLSYYGILYFLPNLAGDRHSNFLIGAGIEALAYIAAFFILSKFGRRIPIGLFQIINAILCIAMGIIKTFYPESHATIYLALIAKGLAVASFCGMFIYCSELFPTICRGVAIGLCGFAARIGSLVAPQLLILVTKPYIPMSVMGVSVMFTGLVTFLLPETLFSRLPNTMAEAIELWGH